MLERGIYPPDFPYEVKRVSAGGYKVAYLDTGPGGQTLLMVHGNPVSGYVFHRLVRSLGAGYRCVVPDLVGFGMSDKPESEEAYSLKMHTDALAGLVGALDLRDVVLVVHDWGGPIGLAAALREPERYTHLVILNTMTEPVMRIAPVYQLPFRFFNRFDGLFSFLVRRLNFFQRMGTAIMEPEDRAVYFRANPTAASRAGIAAFPKMIPYRKEHPTAAFLADLLERVCAWSIPALLVFSDRDSVFSIADGQAFAGRMADATFHGVRGVKHFLQYEAPDEVAGAIRSFLQQRSAL